METKLIAAIKNTAEGREAESILRSCVHCGFCTATCPTYQLLGDELDGPRGRIYLIKQVLEGQPVTRATQLHLDRCLTCRACETVCPSGVQYGRLAEIGKGIVAKQVARPWQQALTQLALRMVLPHQQIFGPLLRIGQALRPWLPETLRKAIPPMQRAAPWPTAKRQRNVILFQGCVQRCATPNTNAATARILDRLGISSLAIAGEGCCGAVDLHLTAKEAALQKMQRNIDAWWPSIEQGAEAIVITASGCGTVLKDYGHALQYDAHYAAKAQRVSALALDISEFLARQDTTNLIQLREQNGQRIAYHSPCSLQHAQRLPGTVESLLIKLGFTLTNVPDSHLCCGSAGTYSILQPELSQQLLNNKLTALQSDNPQCVASANIGCQLHLATQAQLPVKHWIELVDETLRASESTTIPQPALPDLPLASEFRG